MKPRKSNIRIGSGAGFSGDLLEPAIELAEKGNLDYLVFECLAERTIALAQLQKLKHSNKGYDPFLEQRIKTFLPICLRKKIKIISNMGAANPIAAADKIIEIAKELGVKELKVVAVSGDDVLESVQNKDYILLESKTPFSKLLKKVVSANAYLGINPIIKALEQGADIIITGRVADPAIYMAPLFYEFDWNTEDPDILGKATAMGHLLECAAQVCGGYFYDANKKRIAETEQIGFPLADVSQDAEFKITKVQNSGGIITKATCKEQLIYEIHDPKRYITPDVIADFSNISFHEVSKDCIKINGATGIKKTGKLKVSIGYKDGFIGEGQISYGGYQARERAALALNVIKRKFIRLGYDENDTICELIGFNALSKDHPIGKPEEVRLRVAVRTNTLDEAHRIGYQLEALYTNGPAGGGGAYKSVKEIIAVQSILIDENMVNVHLTTKRLNS
jgi:hypothetical protein